MNKGLFLGLAATALLASCSSDEVLESVEPQAISFENAFVDKSTRVVEDITKDNMSTFYVYAKYSDDAEGNTNPKDVYVNSSVEVSSNGTVVKPSSEQYWINGKHYKFRAYSDGNSEISSGLEFDITTGHFTITDYTVAGKDLILSNLVKQQGLAKGNDAVGLTFSHLLSKVKFTFTSGFDKTTTMVISELQFEADKKGTYTTDGSKWTVSSNSPDKSAYTYKTTNGFAGKASNTEEENYVLPQSNLSLNATFTVTVTDANSNKFTKNFTVPLALNADAGEGDENVWKPAYIYNYTATISPANLDAEPIKFEVTEVNGWTEPVNNKEVTPAEKKQE